MLCLVINFWLLKGRRKDDDEILQITLKETPENRAEGPIILFLALAFVDEVFMPNDVMDLSKGPDQLLSLQIPPGREAYKFQYKPNKQDMPVFQMKNRMRSGALGVVRAWTYSSTASSLGNLSYRTGYPRHIKPYDIRRESANAIISKC